MHQLQWVLNIYGKEHKLYFTIKYSSRYSANAALYLNLQQFSRRLEFKRDFNLYLLKDDVLAQGAKEKEKVGKSILYRCSPQAVCSVLRSLPEMQTAAPPGYCLGKHLSSLDTIFVHLVNQQMPGTATLGSIREKVIPASLVVLKCFFTDLFSAGWSVKWPWKSSGIWPDSKTVCTSSEKRDIQERQGRGQAQTDTVYKNLQLWKRDGLAELYKQFDNQLMERPQFH